MNESVLSSPNDSSNSLPSHCGSGQNTLNRVVSFANNKEEISSGTSEISVPCRCNELCTRNGTESQLIYLLCELEASKKANKNLKAQLNAVTSELNNLKLPPQEMTRRYCPGVLTAMVSEIYQAQHDRDSAMMARIRLANDERDEALLRMEEMKEKVNDSFSYGSESPDRNENAKSKSEIFNSDADFLLKHQTSILKEVALRKKLQFDVTTKTKEVDSVITTEDVTDDERESFEKSLKSSSDDKKVEILDERLRFMEQRLAEEMKAKEDAQMLCQKLERLVSVLQKKIKGNAKNSFVSMEDGVPAVVHVE